MDLSLNEVLWTILGSLLSSFKGFARVLDLLFFGFHLPPLVRFSEFFEFSVLDFMRQ